MTSDGHQVLPFLAVADRPDVQARLDEIFFEASLIRSFESENSRIEFRWRWLGRFLEQGPQHAFVALDGEERIAGYLVGAIADPARPVDAELPFYAQFADQTCKFPAHLHINVAPEHRSRGTGAHLIGAFARHAAGLGAPGMHVVTSQGARNVDFYRRCGFGLVATIDWNGRTLVMLGRGLGAATPG